MAVSNQLDERIRLFTIGHSDYTFVQFLKMVEPYSVEELVDVRTSPYSKWATDFNHEKLEMGLDDAGIGYTYMGGALGGRPTNLDLYDKESDDKKWIADYELMANTDEFKDDISQLERIAEERVICLLCSESQPETCHRALLVAEALVECDISVHHILWNGEVEHHESVVDRLINEYQREAKSAESGMFPSLERTRKAALRWQTKRVAFRLDRAPTNTDEHDSRSEH